MKKCILLVLLFTTLFITGCENKQQQPDEYYINLFKTELQIGSTNNPICSVNTISSNQVKVTCRYDKKGNCLVWSNRSYAGCEKYEYKTKTSEKVYDIEYQN